MGRGFERSWGVEMVGGLMGLKRGMWWKVVGVVKGLMRQIEGDIF